MYLALAIENGRHFLVSLSELISGLVFVLLFLLISLSTNAQSTTRYLPKEKGHYFLAAGLIQLLKLLTFIPIL